ncbi:MAG: DNRLRE domain-containing protein, partial [Limisphaerales bacterium]
RIAYRGEDVTLTVGASGFPPLTYQWLHSGTNLPGATSSNLVVARLGPSRTGKYHVIVTDVTGSSVTSSEAELGVIDPRPKTIVLTPSMDTSIHSAGTKPLGNASILSGRRGNGVVDRALLRFDLGAIPTNAVVQSAHVEMTVTKTPNSFPYTFHLHRMITPWNIDAGWLQAANGTEWAAPGGQPGTDFLTNSTSAVVGPGATGFKGLFGPSPEIQSDLQAWLQDRASNAGWILICGSENESKSARHFGSSESQFPARLTITYAVPAPVPEFTSISSDSSRLAFRITPTAGWFYTIEAREHLDAGEWMVLTNLAGGAALSDLFFDLPATNRHQFFRAYRH